MDEQSKAALDLLVQNGYLEIVKEKYRPTKKLNAVPAVDKIYLDDGTVFDGDYGMLYMDFIKACKIPRQGEAGDGSLYDLNKYTEDAAKHFRDLMKSGIKYSVLVKIATTYYRGSTRYKKKIGNYITEGHWRLDYITINNQTEQQQQQHLNEQFNSTKPFTRDRIG